MFAFGPFWIVVIAIVVGSIVYSRHARNLQVAELNRRTEAFPSRVVAERHGFDRADYFDPEGGHR